MKVSPKWAHGKPDLIRNSLRGKIAYASHKGETIGVDERGRELDWNDANTKAAKWMGDDRYYDIIISPTDARHLDLEKFTAQTMAKVRDDVLTPEEIKRGVEIEYLAYQHWNTEHPHVHVLMRANVEDKELRLTDGYICHGMRARAEEVATAALGFRIGPELTEDQSRELLFSRRAELGLDPETGRAPVADSDEAAAPGKHKSTSRDTRSFDGGIE